jgi:hypothetical protein
MQAKTVERINPFSMEAAVAWLKPKIIINLLF